MPSQNTVELEQPSDSGARPATELPPPAPPTSRFRKAIPLLVLSALAAGGVFIWRHFFLTPPVPASLVLVSGRIEGDDSAVAAKTTGRILEIRVREGDTVSAGDIIAALDDQQVRAREAQAIVLGVGGAYLEVIAAKARLDSANSQLETANALYTQSLEQRKVGVVAQVDVDRSEVQVLTQRQRIASLANDLAKQKINLVRMTGLPPNDRYEITDDVPFEASASLNADDAVEEAFRERSDLKGTEAQVQAAERIAAAARAERLPSIALNSDYGVIGTNPANSHGTFSVEGTLRIPLWQGGRAGGDIEQAEAAVAERRAELEDQKAQIESEVRKAYLDLEAAATQVEVARRNIQVSRETLDLTRQRFDAGVADNVEVVQAQESLASASLDYINSVFAHNLAKLTLARSIGNSAENLPRFLKLQ